MGGTKDEGRKMKEEGRRTCARGGGGMMMERGMMEQRAVAFILVCGDYEYYNE